MKHGVIAEKNVGYEIVFDKIFSIISAQNVARLRNRLV
jgi:hypothetical protein